MRLTHTIKDVSGYRIGFQGEITKLQIKKDICKFFCYLKYFFLSKLHAHMYSE